MSGRTYIPIASCDMKTHACYVDINRILKLSNLVFPMLGIGHNAPKWHISIGNLYRCIHTRLRPYNKSSVWGSPAGGALT